MQSVIDKTEGGNVKQLRADLAKLDNAYFSMKKHTQDEYYKMALPIIIKIEMQGKLNDQELALKNKIQNAGAEVVAGTEISDQLGDKIM